MATPEHIKQKARELSNGRSTGEIRRALVREFPDEYIPTERTIRRWIVTEPAIHIEQVIDQIPTSFHGNWKEHNAHLADIANSILANDLSSVKHGWTTNRITHAKNQNESPQVKYRLASKSKFRDYYELTAQQLSNRLKKNIASIYHNNEEWFFHDCFIPHLKSELSYELKNEGFWDVVNKHPYQLIKTLRLLAARKTFKGTCPVCKDW